MYGQADRPVRVSRSALVTRNVWIGDRRTSIRLEPVFWDMLEQVSAREDVSIHEVCTMVANRAGNYGLTGAIRVFLLTYAWTSGLDDSLRAVPVGRLPDDHRRSRDDGPLQEPV